nr:MFS transporter [Alteribacillus sp. YIM 98480]
MLARNAEDTKKLKSQPVWLQVYMATPEKQRKLYHRTLIIVVISQIFGGAGLAAGITTGALLAHDMLGTENYAGVPAALFTLGSAGAALLIGKLSQQFGRRFGLATGFLAGGIGAIGVVASAIMNNIFLLFASLLIYGSGTAANLQARYAGTDLANSTQRATAISIAMVATTLGAVAGPNLVDFTGHIAESIGVPALAGPFILAGAAFLLAGLILLVFMRPDPFIVAKAIAAAVQEQDDTNLLNSVSDRRGIIIGATIMVLTQMIMLAIMTITPIHMNNHGHGLSEIGIVIGIHIGAMYLPSLVTGVLVDKAGRTTMTIVSGFILLAAGVLAAAAPVHSVTVLAIALALLGFGWNIGLITGTALIVDATNPTARAKTQGSVDVFIALAGASGGALSGMIVGVSSFATLSVAGGILSLLLLPLIIWSRRNHNKN